MVLNLRAPHNFFQTTALLLSSQDNQWIVNCFTTSEKLGLHVDVVFLGKTTFKSRKIGGGISRRKKA